MARTKNKKKKNKQPVLENFMQEVAEKRGNSMSRKPQSRGKCQYCGEETAKGGMTRHLARCDKRAQMIQAADSSNQPEETLWHVRVQDAYDREFWLDLEIRGSASLTALDKYLRAIWLECCGHLSKFTVGGWGGIDVGKARKADDVFKRETDLLHLYDFGSTSETEIHVISSRRGGSTLKHPITLMARNNMPERTCMECDQLATHLCMECLIEGDLDDNWFLCEEHAEVHPHLDYGEPVPLVNSPRLGMCGYEGPAEPPY